MKRISFYLTLAALVCCSNSHGAKSAPASAKGLGIAVTPRNFPNHNERDLEEAFRMSRELGEYAVFIFQWGGGGLKDAGLVADKCREYGLRPIIGLSPTTLDRARGELDLPPGVRKKAGKKISFGNPVIKREFKKSARELARLKPPYLCLATEINFLAFKSIDEYIRFAALYKETYREVKKISPQTRVFVSFQWEWTRILDEKEPQKRKVNEHTKLIDIFRPQLDLICFTTYPSPFYDSPDKLPPDYYSWMGRHIKRTDEVMFMETGWPTSGSGSDQEQASYIRRLPDLMKEVNVKIIAWALLHDVAVEEFNEDLNTVGLVAGNGARKPGYEAFMELGKTIW
jgi:hypothetical protein